MLGRPTLSTGGQKAQTGFPGPNPAWRCGHTSLKVLGELLSFSEAESHSSHSLASSSVFKARSRVPCTEVTRLSWAVSLCCPLMGSPPMARRTHQAMWNNPPAQEGPNCHI